MALGVERAADALHRAGAAVAAGDHKSNAFALRTTNDVERRCTQREGDGAVAAG